VPELGSYVYQGSGVGELARCPQASQMAFAWGYAGQQQASSNDDDDCSEDAGSPVAP
jgi:hypothetical protein